MTRSPTSRALAGVVAFASGALYEGLSVVWVHQAVHGGAVSTGVVSALQATAMVAGVGESVRDWRLSPLFVLGYGLGAWTAMVLA